MLPIPRDKHEERAIANIKSHGLHIIYVMEEDDQPAFAYSVGLLHSYQHPEVIIFGLNNDVSMGILNEIARQAKEKNVQFNAGKHYDDVFEGYECTFVDVPQSRYRQHLTWDIWLYGGLEFPVLQCVWPNKEGIFPWERGAPDSFRSCQPVLKFSELN